MQRVYWLVQKGCSRNRDLIQQILAGLSRENLYYRLNTIEIPLPPLRERREDIVRLAEHFLQHFAAIAGRPKPGLSVGSKAALLEHDWPGNVRELEHEMERAVALVDPGKPIEPELLSEALRLPGSMTPPRVRRRSAAPANGPV